MRRISLTTNIDAKVDTSDLKKINVGEVGITQSRLNPMGKVFINDLTVEAKSIDGQMIDEETEVVDAEPAEEPTKPKRSRKTTKDDA